MSIDVSEISKSLQRFSWPDYLVFMLMLLSCMVIGVYFGWKDHKKFKHHRARRGSEALDYLVGGRKMQVFPVAMSLVASFISGISLLGTSTEIYVYGTQYCFIFVAIVLTGIVLHYVYLPVYHELQLTSTYEYLQQRFNRKLRLFGSVLFVVNTMLWLPIVCYVPALSFNQVSGINIHVVTPVVCAVCIFYTCIGGIKAVVWTDVVQTFVMVGGLLLVIYKGTMEVGGFSTVFQLNYDSGRFEEPNLSFDPTLRVTFWSCVIGGTVHWVGANGAQQAQIQRYFSLSTLKRARVALWIFIVASILIKIICVYNGLLLYATYHDCDPLTTKLAKAKDQLMPLLVMRVLGDYPGLPGMFIAGIFSAALSSLSTGLNSLAAVTLEDFIKPFFPDLSEAATAKIMRISVVVYGVFSIAMVFIVERLGAVLQLSASLSGMSMGPLLGIFTLGLFFPWVHSRYLGRRFDKRIRLFGSISYLLTSIIWIPIVIYVPSLAFAQVTGINIHYTSPIICAVCIFYTCVGGLKAVVWTDVIQGVIMLLSMIVVAVKATKQVGGLDIVIKRNYESGRIEGPIWDLDPTIRHSFWSTVVGGFIYWNSINGPNQSMVQRYLSLPSLESARKACWWFVAGVILILSFCCYNGLLIYALYHDCDPLQTGLAKQKDQLVPLLVMNVLGEYPGLTGCFVAGVFSAALSSLSTGLNSLAAVVLEDFVKPLYKDKLSEKATAYIMRLTVVFFGLLATALVFVVEHLGQVLQLSISLSGATLGPLLAIYFVGLFLPWINATCTLVGAVSGLISAMWIVFRAQADIANNVLTFATKPTSTEGCTYSFSNKNITTTTNVDDFYESTSKPIHHMSYLYYTLFGAIITVFIACIASFILGKQTSEETDTLLLAPVIRKFVKNSKTKTNMHVIMSENEKTCTTYEFEQEKVSK